MTAIYNELDRYPAEWLRNLISGGHIANGVVDERSIADLAAADVTGPGQRHFFAGIGGWSYALRLAGVTDDADVWTGSCPCQPFSAAGRGLGTADVRHLWPEWFRLIRECRPATIFGEQVASPAGLGWLDAVFADLEGAGYACAAADLPAAGVGAPHIRQRLYFVAYAGGKSGRLLAAQRQPGRADAQAFGRGEAGGVADGSGMRRSEGIDGRETRTKPGPGLTDSRRARPLANGGSSGLEVQREQQAWRQLEATERGSATGGMGNSDGEPGRRYSGAVSRAETEIGGGLRGSAHRSWSAGDHVDWSACDWIPCSDGKQRPVEPGAHPLAHGISGRVGLLRGYGNAIVPAQAAAFVVAALEAAS